MSQNRFHHFSIGFTQLSNLFQPFAIGFNQLSNLFHCFFHWFSAVVQHIATFYHRLSSVVQSISLVWASAFISFFFPVLGTISKGVLCSKNTLRELDLTSYPFWMVLWQLSSCSSMRFYFFYNSLFPEMAVQDDQSVKTSIYTNYIHICWSGQNRFHHFSIGFTQLSNLFQPFAIGFNQLSNLFHCLFISFRQLFNTGATWIIETSKSHRRNYRKNPGNGQKLNDKNIIFCCQPFWGKLNYRKNWYGNCSVNLYPVFLIILSVTIHVSGIHRICLRTPSPKRFRKGQFWDVLSLF